ncbi:hypothetical protein EGT74_19390 [Chitinophaga lutea]|uniref:Uncharacterized protein n=1 Tax=Chitinophaga lutea TaxID=2488634 RepID=A0A3N4PKG9_9BACT|nr:hypothetical protein EGT74_19390 [Chitinophaga lutea]
MRIIKFTEGPLISTRYPQKQLLLVMYHAVWQLGSLFSVLDKFKQKVRIGVCYFKHCRISMKPIRFCSLLIFSSPIYILLNDKVDDTTASFCGIT